MAVSLAIPVTRHPFADGSSKRILIDVKWVDAASGKKFETLNPATGELLATVAEGDAEDINRAVAAARRAFEGPWSKVKPFERQNLLLKLADNRATFYGGELAGYTDYPVYDELAPA